MPAAIAAWRAGFCPWPADRIWPMITSLTSPAATPARASAALIASAPSAWADRSANAPEKLPTGVRAALAMTISVRDMDFSSSGMTSGDWPDPDRVDLTEKAGCPFVKRHGLNIWFGMDIGARLGDGP